MATPGLIDVKEKAPHRAKVRLFNFDIGRHELKPEHADWLRRNVVGILKRGGSLWITGMTSRSDTERRNMALSRRRADEVIGFLRKESPNGFQIRLDAAEGEEWAKALGIRDDTEMAEWRAVELIAASTPIPPPPPPPPFSPKVPRITHREFLKVKAENLARPPDPSRDISSELVENVNAVLGGELGDFTGTWGDELMGSRRIEPIPANHHVNRVVMHKEYRSEQRQVSTLTYNWSATIDYTWGFPALAMVPVTEFWDIELQGKWPTTYALPRAAIDKSLVFSPPDPVVRGG